MPEAPSTRSSAVREEPADAVRLGRATVIAPHSATARRGRWKVRVVTVRT
jgi:hypothetical protein